MVRGEVNRWVVNGVGGRREAGRALTFAKAPAPRNLSGRRSAGVGGASASCHGSTPSPI